MAKIQNITILNKSTIRLDVDCKKDDVIDLLDVNKIDISILDEKIQAAYDAQFAAQAKEYKDRINIEYQLQLNQIKADLQSEIDILKEKNQSIEMITKSSVQKEYELINKDNQNELLQQISVLKQTNLELEKSIDERISNLKLSLENKNIEEKNQLIQELNSMKLKNEALNSSVDEKVKLAEFAVLSKSKEEQNRLNQEVNTFKLKVEELKNSIEEKIKLAEFTVLSQSKDEQNRLSHEIAALKFKNEELNKQIEEKIKLTEISLENKYKDELNDKENEINNLKRSRNSLNIKKIGEELEKWCDQEYTSYSQNGFINCTWEKDNKSIKEEDEIKGTKADYVFKVYASENCNEDEILTSVACEMKSEDPLSINKKKNSDHYAKLDKDRIKKNCEYALLISELEWDQDNDVPIRKVANFDKMYMVRPQYFITFLSIIQSLGKKYQDIILKTNEEKIEFKEKQDILDEFEKFKNIVILKNLEIIEKQAMKISSSSDKIAKLNNEIKESTKVIIDNILEKIKTKIENYKIYKKIVEKIDNE